MSFLHSNVEVRLLDVTCPSFYSRFTISQLLFPIKDKDYIFNEMIKEYWEETLEYIKNALVIIVLGYCAPSSDAVVMKLLKSVYGDLDDRSNDEFSFINIEDEEVCLEKLKDFLYTVTMNIQKIFDSYTVLFSRYSVKVEF